jgi:hypothetical protein
VVLIRKGDEFINTKTERLKLPLILLHNKLCKCKN